ncbi:hypothetical protein QUB60_01140 [Microcoleus sp. A2-C5]
MTVVRRKRGLAAVGFILAKRKCLDLLQESLIDMSTADEKQMQRR